MTEYISSSMKFAITQFYECTVLLIHYCSVFVSHRCLERKQFRTPQEQLHNGINECCLLDDLLKVLVRV